MVGEDDRSEWARKFLHPDDIDEIQWKSDRFIAFEQPAVSMNLELTINEAIRMCRSWDMAVEGDIKMQRQFLDALNGAMDYVAQCLDDMDIDYQGEFIDDDWNEDDETD